MTTSALPSLLPSRADLGRSSGVLIAIGVFAAIVVTLDLITPGPLSYFEFSYLSSGGTALALLAMGQTLVILSRGFDLSCGATLSLVNALLATQMGSSVESQMLWAVIGLGVGVAVGTINGLLVTYLRLQPVVVTLAMMFILQGIAILLLPKPGGRIGQELSAFLTYDAIPEVLPAPVVVILVAILVWLLIKRSRFGTALYAVGSDIDAARANGIPVRRTLLLTYMLAGLYFGAAGVFVGATTGSGDALVGRPMLMQTFAAVVLGGTALSGGRGGLVGTVFGAFTLMIVVNILLVLNFSAYYATVVEAVIIILAVIGASLGRSSPLMGQVRSLRLKLGAWRRGTLPSRLGGTDRTLRLIDVGTRGGLRADPQLQGSALARWARRNGSTLSFVLPAYVLLVVVLVATYVIFGDRVLSLQYLNSLLVLTSFVAILGLGQGAVILGGGFDLSVPWTITFCGLLIGSLTNGSNEAIWWAIPLVLLVGAGVGIFNGLAVVVFGISPIVATLAANGLMHGLALVYTQGDSTRFGPPALSWFMNDRILGLSPVVWFLLLFVAGATVLLSRTPFGRRLYAVGCSHRGARMSGINVGGVVIGSYVLSGLCSATVGLLLVGFGNLAVLSMGEPYLLPAVAVVVVGGTAVTGGRGHYLGIFGGALLLTGLSTMLSGTTWPEAVRDILFGLVVLGAIITLREKFG